MGFARALHFPSSYASVTQRPGLVLLQRRGLFQDNGAVPWYSNLGLGTPAQSIKVAMDTGTNFNWVSSIVGNASAGAVRRPGGQEFDEARSASLHWLNSQPEMVSFGPAGSMTVLSGVDKFRLNPSTSLDQSFNLAKRHTGQQFLELDYDGGWAFPSSNRTMKDGMSFLMEDLMNAGLIDPAHPYLSFDWDATRGTGTCQVGGVDPLAFDAASGIRMPWTPYRDFPDAEYLWSTPLKHFGVSGKTIARELTFALDSGSSQFKGDTDVMNATLDLVSKFPGPVQLCLGTLMDGITPGVLQIPASLYTTKIQAGRGAGETKPQFAPLGTKNLVLVGSTLMDYLYTVFEYSVSHGPQGYTLSAAAMYLFNKTIGPNLVKSVSRPVISLR